VGSGAAAAAGRHTASSKAGNPLFMADTPAPGRREV